MVQASVVGTWRLVSCEGRRSTGDVSPYGDAPVGFLMYSADGYMAVFVMRPGRSPFASGDRFRGSAVVRGGETWTFRLVWARAEPAGTLATVHSRGMGDTQ